jgi:hypothetical protein
LDDRNLDAEQVEKSGIGPHALILRSSRFHPFSTWLTAGATGTAETEAAE